MIPASYIADMCLSELDILETVFTIWDEEAQTLIDNGILPDSALKWLKHKGFTWPMTPEQEFEFKLRYMQ